MLLTWANMKEETQDQVLKTLLWILAPRGLTHAPSEVEKSQISECWSVVIAG